MKQTKSFKYDILIHEGDFCNRKKEIKMFLKRTRQKKKTILFAPRRYGKTSLIKNVVGNNHNKSHPNHVMIYVDLMDVKSFQSISERLKYSISKSLSEHFPVKTALSKRIGLIKNLSINMNIDATSGQPSLSFAIKDMETKKGCRQLMEIIKKLSEKYNLLLILDEFQDIAFVEEAEAFFRGFLQELSETAVFILGSKRHLLKTIFSDAHAPLFNFGDEIHLSPISVDHWYAYYQERLSPFHIKIEKTEMLWILKQLCHVPNAICELGAWLVDNCSNTKLTCELIKKQLDLMVESKQSYHYLLQGYTQKEQAVLKQIAIHKFVLSPQSTSFLNALSISKSSVGKIIKKLMDLGTIEFELNQGYRVSDPILGHYLAIH